MAWNLSSERPIYAQIIEKIQQDIISGNYAPGDRLPSVRDLASEAAVNPNTMQKALTELERTGLVFAQRTSGRYITEDIIMMQKMKEEIASAHIKEFLDKMAQLGFKKQEIIDLITQLEKIDEEEKE